MRRRPFVTCPLRVRVASESLHTSAGAGDQAVGLLSGDRRVSGAAYSHRMRRRLVLGAAFLASGLLRPSQALGRAPLTPEPATIVSVHDGDTIQVRISGRKEKVRLLG